MPGLKSEFPHEQWLPQVPRLWAPEIALTLTVRFLLFLVGHNSHSQKSSAILQMNSQKRAHWNWNWRNSSDMQSSRESGQRDTPHPPPPPGRTQAERYPPFYLQFSKTGLQKISQIGESPMRLPPALQAARSTCAPACSASGVQSARQLQFYLLSSIRTTSALSRNRSKIISLPSGETSKFCTRYPGCRSVRARLSPVLRSTR